MRQRHSADRLEFYNDRAFNNNIGNELTNNLIVLANNNRRLRCRSDAFFPKFNHQAFLIHGFQEPKTQLVVNTVGTPDDLLSELFMFHERQRSPDLDLAYARQFRPQYPVILSTNYETHQSLLSWTPGCDPHL